MENKEHYYLAVDLGATSGRTILAHYDGERIHQKEFTRFGNPIIPLHGHLFWDLPALYYQILLALKKAAAEHIRLTSIGIDTWGCDFAVFNNEGLLNGLPYSYRDPHTDGVMPRLFERMDSKKIYNLTGIQFMPFNSIFQLFQLTKSQASILNNAHKIMFIPDALSYMLTGNAVTERTVASTSGLLNAHVGQLDNELLQAIDIKSDCFAPVVEPGHLIGELSAEVQAFTGMGAIPVVAVAGHDTASAVLAVPSPDEDYAYLSCGTWSLLGIETTHPIINHDSFELNFTNEGGVMGTTRFLKNICGLWIFERCREEFKQLDSLVNTDVKALIELSKTSDYKGTINPDDELFAHPDSMISAINTYCKDHNFTPPTTVADYVHLIFRSLALRYKEVLDTLQKLSPHPIKRLHVIGGGSQNEYLMQLTANAIGLPVVCGPTEATALGNTLIQVSHAMGGMSLQEMRKIAAQSVEMRTYRPQHN